MSPLQWLITAASFLLMFGASGWVLATNWPTGGMPWMGWAAHGGAVLAVCIEICTRAFKIQASTHALGMPIRFVTALRVCLGGDFAAAITPARSGAEPARFLILGESAMPVAGRVLLLFLELVLEALSLAVICLGLAVAFAGRGASVTGMVTLVIGYSGTVCVVGVLLLLIARFHAQGPAPRWARALRLGGARWDAVQHAVAQLRVSLKALRTARRAPMVLAFAGSLLHVVCKVTVLPALVYLADPVFPRTMETLAPLVLWPLALFYGGVVVPAPGGGGFIEGAFAATLKTAIPAGIFAASLLWWRFYTFYLYLVIGGLAAGDAALRAVRRRANHASAPHGSD